MTHKLITTENYLLVVDDSDININQYVYCDLGYIEKVMDIINGWVYHTKMLGKNPIKHYKKIIAHLPLNPPFIYGYTNSPILEGVDILPPLEDEAEKLADELYLEKSNRINDSEIRGYIVSATKGGFVDGYNKAKEKYKYTEEDLSKALSYGYHTAKDEAKGIPSSGYFTRFIQSLQQPKMPVAFECEMENYCGSPYTTERCPKCVDICDKAYQRPKKTTNSQGLTQWVGEYIY